VYAGREHGIHYVDKAMYMTRVPVYGRVREHGRVHDRVHGRVQGPSTRAVNCTRTVTAVDKDRLRLVYTGRAHGYTRKRGLSFWAMFMVAIMGILYGA